MNYQRLRAYLRKRLRTHRGELWGYYAFREEYRRAHGGSYGPLEHLREIPRLIAELEDILAQR